MRHLEDRTDVIAKAINSVMEIVPKILKVKEEIDRVAESDERIYELSRLLTPKEGYELLKIYKQTKEDLQEIYSVIYQQDE